MIVAERLEVKSVSFPPISSGIYGAVSKELVANVMLSTLCSYKCSSPSLLTDVRIVMIDDPIYQVFLNVLHRNRQHLESLLGAESNLSIVSKYHSIDSSTTPRITTTPKVEMATNDLLSQQLTNQKTEYRQEKKRSCSGSKGQTNSSAFVTIAKKHLPPTTKRE